ncbi:UNVERIFIED_CONTAM: hypothetical protein LBW93_05510 [Wolbachia endosymbiont of Nasonia longicornis]
MPILQQNALVTIYLKAFLLTITSINTSYATKPACIWCNHLMIEFIVYLFHHFLMLRTIKQNSEIFFIRLCSPISTNS